MLTVIGVQLFESDRWQERRLGGKVKYNALLEASKKVAAHPAFSRPALCTVIEYTKSVSSPWQPNNNEQGLPIS